MFEVQGNYRFLPITVPGTERERKSTENLVNLLHPSVPGCALDTRESNPIIKQEKHTADQSTYHLADQIGQRKLNTVGYKAGEWTRECMCVP